MNPSNTPATHRSNLLALAILLTLPQLAHAKLATDTAKPNVLFISVDDLRPELGCYGKASMKTPNIDRIAAQGTVFKNAFCQIAICMPSRTSVLSGYRPETVQSGKIESDKYPKGMIPLPQLFRNAGYTAVSIGKILHYNDDGNQFWDRKYKDTFHEQAAHHGWCSGYQLETNKSVFANYGRSLTRKGGDKLPRPAAVEISNAPDKAYPDGVIARTAVEELKKLKAEGKPFFLATGFYRPHLPFAVPKKYWDMYDRNDIHLPANSDPVIDGVTKNDWTELRRYGDIPNKGPLSKKQAKELIHGYYASVSFSDAMIGKVLDELKNLGLDKNTIIVLWGDHGWNLGEHGWWCKHTNYETSTRTVMLASAPGMKKNISTEALVELIDLYPSLCELANINAPAYLEGTSFVPLMKNPKQPWKKAVFSMFGRARTIRTQDYRLIEHKKSGAIELFDLKIDPGETRNVAKKPPYKKIKNKLLEQLNAGWKAAIPTK
jgi:iduronate 2-sulfatase